MDCQDWNTVTFNTPSLNKKRDENKKINSNKIIRFPSFSNLTTYANFFC